MFELTTTQAKRGGMKSSEKSRATVPQRLMFKEGRKKLAENLGCVTGKDLQVGGGRTRGSREGGFERGTWAEAEDGSIGESKGG